MQNPTMAETEGPNDAFSDAGRAVVDEEEQLFLNLDHPLAAPVSVQEEDATSAVQEQIVAEIVVSNKTTTEDWIPETSDGARRRSSRQRTASKRARSPGSEFGSEDGNGDEEPMLYAEDGSPILTTKPLTLTEAAEVLLCHEKEKKVARGCRWIPRMAARIGNCTFFLDLERFPDSGLVFGDLACDGYEPWGHMASGGQFFARIGKDFQRVNMKDKAPDPGIHWDLVVRERRTSKVHAESMLSRRIYTVEDPDKNILLDYGGLLVYMWKGPIIDFPSRPHGNSRRPEKVSERYIRTAPSTMRRAQEKLLQQSIPKRDIFEETNREAVNSGSPLGPAHLLRDTSQVSYLARRRSDTGYRTSAPSSKKMREDDFDFALRESFLGRFVKSFAVVNSEGTAVPHVFCAQDRQLEMIRKFGCFKPPDSPDIGVDLSEKRVMYAELLVGFSECYLTLLGMTHPYFEAYDTGQEAFLPVAYFLCSHREKMDFERCAHLLSQLVDRRSDDLVFFGLVADVESALYAAFRDKPMFQEPCQHVLSELHLRESIDTKLKQMNLMDTSRAEIMVHIFGRERQMDPMTGEWRLDEGCLIDSQTEEELEMRLEALKVVWDAEAPGFFHFFRKTKLDLLKLFYLLGQRESANLRESRGRTTMNRMEELEEFLKQQMRGRKRLGIEETIQALDRYTDTVYHKLEVAVIHGSRVFGQEYGRSM